MREGTPARRDDGPRRDVVVRDRLLLTLAGAAGCVDAVSYLGLGRVFTANMTGHAVLLGMAVVEAEGDTTLRGLAALGGFVAGAAVGSWIADPHPRARAWSPAVTRALWVKCGLLLALAMVWLRGAPRSAAAAAVFIALSALAMGIQSAAARSLAVPGVATTYITGTLTSLVGQAVAHLRHRLADEGGEPPRPPRLLAAVWVVYVAGAMLGAAAMKWTPSLAFAIPAALAVTATGVAARRFRA